MIDNRESEELSGYKEIGNYNKNSFISNETAPNDDKIQWQKEFVKQKEFEKMNFIQKTWVKFDEKVMKPFFLGKEKPEEEVSLQKSLISHLKKPEMIEFTSKENFGQK